MKVEISSAIDLNSRCNEFQPEIVVQCYQTPSPVQIHPAFMDDILNWDIGVYKNAIRVVLGLTQKRILFQCQHGMSRSAALAIVKLYSEDPGAVPDFLQSHPEAQPNPLILMLADEILDTDGALVRLCKGRYKGAAL